MANIKTTRPFISTNNRKWKFKFNDAEGSVEFTGKPLKDDVLSACSTIEEAEFLQKFKNASGGSIESALTSALEGSTLSAKQVHSLLESSIDRLGLNLEKETKNKLLELTGKEAKKETATENFVKASTAAFESGDDKDYSMISNIFYKTEKNDKDEEVIKSVNLDLIEVDLDEILKGARIEDTDGYKFLQQLSDKSIEAMRKKFSDKYSTELSRTGINLETRAKILAEANHQSNLFLTKLKQIVCELLKAKCSNLITQTDSDTKDAQEKEKRIAKLEEIKQSYENRAKYYDEAVQILKAAQAKTESTHEKEIEKNLREGMGSLVEPAEAAEKAKEKNNAATKKQKELEEWNAAAEEVMKDMDANFLADVLKLSEGTIELTTEDYKLIIAEHKIPEKLKEFLPRLVESEKGKVNPAIKAFNEKVKAKLAELAKKEAGAEPGERE